MQYDEKVKNVQQELRPWGDEAAIEFGNALRGVVAHEEDVDLSATELLPKAWLPADMEVDAVVRVDKPSGAVLYVGSRKTFCNSKAALLLMSLYRGVP